MCTENAFVIHEGKRIFCYHKHTHFAAAAAAVTQLYAIIQMAIKILFLKRIFSGTAKPFFSLL